MINKSLLTQEDIKNFIYETIQKVHPRKEIFYCAKNLSKVLGISLYNIKQYTKIGMPHIKYKKSKRYNINKVTSWLIENNIPYTINEQE